MRSFQVCSARASFWETVMRSRKACSSLTPRSVASARLRISVSEKESGTSLLKSSYQLQPKPASTRKQNNSNRSDPWCYQSHIFSTAPRLFRSGSFSKTPMEPLQRLGVLLLTPVCLQRLDKQLFILNFAFFLV